MWHLVLPAKLGSSKLDLNNAYHLVRICEDDEWKKAFNTPLGHSECFVMLFGLTNSPAVFHSLVNDVLCDMLNKFLFVYVNNILIFSDKRGTRTACPPSSNPRWRTNTLSRQNLGWVVMDSLPEYLG